VHQLAAGHGSAQRSDRELLDDFSSRRDEAAFAALVARHGPMVLRVCRRVLNHEEDSADAFQATFLILVRKRESIRKPEALAQWLHGVAYRTAMQVKRSAARRRDHETRLWTVMRKVALSPTWDDVQAVLDEEIQRLPETYRAAFVLCVLEGKRVPQAAGELGVTEGAVWTRLTRARQLLQRRLTRRGIKLAAVLAVLHVACAAEAGLPAVLATVTIRSGLLVAAGASAAGVIPARVAALATAVTRTMVLTRAKIAVALLLTVGLVVAGARVLTRQTLAARETAPVAPKAAPPVEEEAQPPTNPPGNPLALPAGALARLGWDPLRPGHFRATLTPDGKKVIALSDAGILHVCEAATGKLLERRPLGDRRQRSAAIYSCSLSADGTVAAVMDNSDGVYRLTAWRLVTGQRLLQCGPVSSTSYALAPDGRALATVKFLHAEGKRILRVYDLETGKPGNLAVSGNLVDFRFTPDGKRLLGHDAGGQGTKIVCHDVASAKRLWAVPGVADIGFTPDSRLVFLARRGAKEPFRALDAETGKPAEALKLPPYEAAGEPAPAGDRLLLVPLRSGEVAVWDYRAGKELRRLRATPRNFLSVRVFVAADGKTALTDGDALRRWDLASGAQIFGPSAEPAHYGVVHALAFPPGGGLLSASAGGELRRWDIGGGRSLAESGRASGQEVWITRAGVRMIKAEWSRDLTVMDTAGKRVGKVTLPHVSTPLRPDLFWKYALLSDGRTAVAYVPRKDKVPVVAVTDYVAGKVLAEREVNVPLLPSWAAGNFQGFAPCGRWLAANGQVFAVSTGKLVWTPSPGDGWEMGKQSAATYSPDGRLLCGRVSVTSSEKKEDFLRGEHDIWEVASGQRLVRFEARHLGRVALSPDNRTLAYVTGFGVHLIDVLTGKLLAEYEDPGINCANYMTGPAVTLLFAPDGRTVATGHDDGSILVWKVPRPAAAKLTKADREAVWDDLASTDVARARRAVDLLARNLAAAVALLGERFKAPVAPADVDVAALIRALDSEVFAERERASRQLRQVGLKAEAALREAHKTATLEGQRRIDKLLAALDTTQLPLTRGEVLRGVRAIEVLERVGTPAARRLLQAWADHVAEPRLATEARLAVERLRISDPHP
jgi:RNA polymerase sigma factor (sigma-70 family)